MSETQIVAPGVILRDYPGRRKHYEGKKDALIAAGLAEESWFVADGTRDKRGRTTRSKTFERDGRLVETRVPAKGPAYVEFHCTDAEWQAEQDRRQAAEEKKQQRHMDEREAVALSWIPNSHERFRDLMLRVTRTCLDQRRFLEAGLGGYRYSSETIEEFEEAIEEALEILAEGKTSFNPQRQAQKIAAIKTSAAKSDHGLQQFLQGAVEGSADRAG